MLYFRTLCLKKTELMLNLHKIALDFIRIYQGYISPYKGFSCAYRVHTGRQSCSELGFRAIRKYGLVAGISVLRKRTYLCGVVHRRNHMIYTKRPPISQRGDCDLPCDSPCDLDCDLSSGKSCSRWLDGLSCCDSYGCDWSQRNKRKQQDKEKTIYIPPKRPKL